MVLQHGDRILVAARKWVKTPWQHNQKCLGHGVDCVRFIEAVFKDDLGYQFDNISKYARLPDDDAILKYLQGLHCVKEIPLTAIQPGDLLLFRIGKIPAHLGISNGQGIIHADSHHGVIEVNNLGRWQQRLIANFRVIE